MHHLVKPEYKAKPKAEVSVTFKFNVKFTITITVTVLVTVTAVIEVQGLATIKLGPRHSCTIGFVLSVPRGH